MDRGNGPSHQGLRSIQRLRARYRNLLLVHGPIRTNWLNQVEIYFSVPHREALTPNAFDLLDEPASRLDTFERQYETCVKPFEWKLTREDLRRLLHRTKTVLQPCCQLAA